MLPVPSIPERKVVVGNPAKIVKDVTDEMLAWKSEGTKLYQQLPARLKVTLLETAPLLELPKDRPPMASGFKPWGESKG